MHTKFCVKKCEGTTWETLKDNIEVSPGKIVCEDERRTQRWAVLCTALKATNYLTGWGTLSFSIIIRLPRVKLNFDGGDPDSKNWIRNVYFCLQVYKVLSQKTSLDVYTAVRIWNFTSARLFLSQKLSV